MCVSKVFARGAVALMILAGGADLAAAASAVCNNLEARLASVQRGASGGKAAGFANAAKQQRAEIAVAENQARQAGCSGGFRLFKAAPGPECGPILKRIAGMKANLGKIENRRQSAGGDSSGRQRAELLRQLGANDCGPQYASYSNQGRQRNFLERLFSPQDNAAARPAMVVPPQATGRVIQRDDSYDSGGYDVGFGGGKYRTLCVRTCDGYYFPIANSTTRSSFAAQEQVCKQLCPGTEVVLYAHRNPGQDSSKALSIVDRTRYSELPTAFSYRTSLTPGCACGKSAALDIVAGGYSPAAMNSAFQGLAPIPDMRPTPGEDPETVANRRGELDPVEVGKPNVTAPVASLTIPPSGPARRVGPSYFYAQ